MGFPRVTVQMTLMKEVITYGRRKKLMALYFCVIHVRNILLQILSNDKKTHDSTTETVTTYCTTCKLKETTVLCYSVEQVILFIIKKCVQHSNGKQVFFFFVLMKKKKKQN